MKYKYNNQWVDVNIKALDSMVIGSIIQFVGTTIPTGWLECDGSTITQSAYPELYDLIGGTLPDFRGRVLVGQNTTDTDFDTLLETGGYKGLQKHTHQSVELGGNTMTSWSSSGSGGIFNLSSLFQSNQFNNNQVNTGNVNGNATDNGAPSTAINGNLQPYAVVKHIIKATNTTPTMASVVNASNNSTTDTYSCDYENKHYGGVVLYDNSSGTTSDVSLTMPTGETLSDYSYIEIYAITDDNEYFYTKAPSVVNRNVVIAMTHYYDNVVYTYVKSFKINASSLTINTTISGGGYYGGGMGVNNRDNISVIKVVGYK